MLNASKVLASCLITKNGVENSRQNLDSMPMITSKTPYGRLPNPTELCGSKSFIANCKNLKTEINPFPGLQYVPEHADLRRHAPTLERLYKNVALFIRQ